LRYESAVDVRALRQAADDVARRLRELDTRSQQINWSTERRTMEPCC
jgi:cell division protein ZapA (FtsZ GTPase activity inhibitor)